MAKVIFNVFFTIIQTAVNIILAPLTPIINTLLPDFSDMINKFSILVNTYLGDTISWFSSILPPTARSLILIYLTFLITYYTVSYTVHGFVKIFIIIKKIKFW